MEHPTGVGMGVCWCTYEQVDIISDLCARRGGEGAVVVQVGRDGGHQSVRAG